MEKFLVKTSIYGFICSLATGILFIEKNVTFTASNGNQRSYEKGVSEYVLEVLRFSIKTTIVLLVLALLYRLFQKYKH